MQIQSIMHSHPSEKIKSAEGQMQLRFSKAQPSRQQNATFSSETSLDNSYKNTDHTKVLYKMSCQICN